MFCLLLRFLKRWKRERESGASFVCWLEQGDSPLLQFFEGALWGCFVSLLSKTALWGNVFVRV